MAKDQKISFANFRDLGGLQCPDGKKILPGKIFRSQILAPKSQADRDFLSAKKLDVILDLRTPEEASSKRDWIPQGCAYINSPAYSEADFPNLSSSTVSFKKNFQLKGNHLRELVVEKKASYQFMPFAKSAYSQLFNLLDAGKTFVFHCVAGNDRTGIGAMLIEFALGRTRTEIFAEYLRSNETRKIHRRNWLKLFDPSGELVENIFFCESVHQDLLDLSLESMLRNYAAPMDFLRSEYDVTPDRVKQWQAVYLE